MKKKIWIHVVWFILSGVVIYLYNVGEIAYSVVGIVLLLVLQPLLLPGFSIPFNIVAGYTLGWFPAFCFSYVGWLVGTAFTSLVYKIPGMTFTPKRLPEIKTIIEKRWWIVSAASVVPVFPIDFVVRMVMMTRIMSFSKLFLSVAVAAPLSRLPPCLLGKMNYSIILYPSLWTQHDAISILVYALYFAIGGIAIGIERIHLLRIKSLFSKRELDSFS